MSPVIDPEGSHLAALRRLADFRGARVLEMGCGDGRLTEGIAEDAAHVLAFDPDAEAVERARTTFPAELADRVSFRVASAEQLEIAPGSFDLVVFSWSLWCVKPEGVVDALGRMIDAVRPGGVILDLQVIRPDPLIELDGDVIAGIDGAALFESADAATAAIDVRIAAGDLVEEAVDDHHVLEHFADGAELVAHFADSRRNIDEAAVPRLRPIGDPLVTREACRLRRLRIV